MKKIVTILLLVILMVCCKYLYDSRFVIKGFQMTMTERHQTFMKALGGQQ